jgi:small subunit ribosomal protein S8e
MGVYQEPIKAKSSGTGGRKRKSQDKKLYYAGNEPTNARLGKEEIRVLRSMRGSGRKVRLKTALYANLVGKEGKIQKAKIRNVVETPDNRHHARQNIITKGAIIDTELGKARVTNRVGQDGVVNGILV